MSQFGAATGGKNPPWARAATDFSAPPLTNTSMGQQGGVGLPQPGMGGPPGMYNLAGATSQALQTQNQALQNQALQNQFQAQQLAVTLQQGPTSQAQTLQTQALQSQFQAQQMAAVRMQQAAVVAALQPPPQQTAVLPQPGIAIPTTLGSSSQGAVSYPAPRPPQGQAGKQRVFTGHVTKLHDNFGFVDEDVFFQTSCVKGAMPKVGDRVLVEASFNQNMPFKWNATRIQVLNVPNQGSIPSSQGNGSVSLGKPFVTSVNSFMQGSVGQTSLSSSGPQPLVMKSTQSTSLLSSGSLRANRRDRFERNRKREDRERRDKDRDRSSGPVPVKRSRSPKKSLSPQPSRARSPSRRRPALQPRYVVQVPKSSLDMKEASVVTLRSRYVNMYVPSDFYNANMLWNEGFPLVRPFQLGNSCSFHIMSKEAERVGPNTAVLDPPDADHLYSAKVMLISSPCMDDLYHKSCALSQDPENLREHFSHPTRLINFLVGVKGKNEPIAIGGPWSPSLDGPNPGEDLKVLIKTAIRTTKALTGINLSSCTQWYRFAEVRYLRPEETHKGKLVPARVETSVIFLPDVWSCQPTGLEWGTLQVAFKKQLQKKLAQQCGTQKEDVQEDEEETAETEAGETKDPTHFTELDPKTMKILDLRKELECRNLSSKGLKSQLIARLTKTLKSEQEKEEEEGSKEVEEIKVEEEPQPSEEQDEEKKKEEEDKKKKEEKEKATLERHYTLPDQPSIIVYPNPTAKGGKFDCAVMSLSVLLDYRPEDNKEHSFEVSLFAELFNEMLMRDFGFEIYKAMCRSPEKPKEEEKKEKKDKEKEKEKEKDKKKEEDKEPAVKKKKTEERDKDKKDTDKKENKRKDEESAKDSKKDDKTKEDEDEKDKKKEKQKFMTVNPFLLLAFVYYDQNHTRYIQDKDMEEIVHALGLQLSRAQVKKLVQKMSLRSMIHYRKLTDKPILEADEEEKPELPEIEVDPDDLAKGNSCLVNKQPGLEDTPSKRKASSKEPLTGFVMFNGAMVDIESVMQRLEKSEKGRAEVEQKLKEVTEEHDSLKKTSSKKDESYSKLNGEVKTLKHQLSSQEKASHSAISASKKYKSVLTDVQDQLTKLTQTVSTAVTEVTSDSHMDIKKEVRKEKEVKKEPEENGR